MEKKATIVVLSPRFPYPLEKGDKLRLYHQLLGLASVFKIHLLSLSEDTIEKEQLEIIQSICKSVHIIEQKKWRNVRAAIKSLFLGESIQQCYYFDLETKKKVDSLILEINPDAIFVQLIRMAKFVEDYDTPKLLDYMDAMSLNMEREAKKHKFPFSYIYNREARLLAKAEKEMSLKFNEKLIISDQDKKYLESLEINNLTVQSNGVDLDYFNAKELDEVEESFDLVFVGNMGYLPNVEAVEYFVNHILKTNFPDLKFLIAGARPHDRVKRLASQQVVVSGWVEDIRSSYLSGKIVIAPIFTGAGQQNKILEAMALGKACITTTQVNAAINASSTKEILIADNSEQFVSVINLLLKSSSLRYEIGRNARIFVEQNFEWKKQVEVLEKVLKKLVK